MKGEALVSGLTHSPLGRANYEWYISRPAFSTFWGLKLCLDLRNLRGSKSLCLYPISFTLSLNYISVARSNYFRTACSRSSKNSTCIYPGSERALARSCISPRRNIISTITDVPIRQRDDPTSWDIIWGSEQLNLNV